MNSFSIQRVSVALILSGLMVMATFNARGATDLREAGRQLAKEYGSSIVSVQIVVTVKWSMGGRSDNERERRMEVAGTVVSADGLTIVPLSAIDPASDFKNQFARQDLNVDSRVKDIKIIVEKRNEIPATVVLRDNDLNIAFLRPLEKPEKPMTFIELGNAAEPQLLEEATVLARMGKVADREVSVMTGEIQAIITKPRTFYVPSSELATGGMGVPIFNVENKMIGIVLMRSQPGGMDVMAGGGQSGTLAIILPTKDVKEVADQASTKAPEPLTKDKPATTDKTTTDTTPTTDTTIKAADSGGKNESQTP